MDVRYLIAGFFILLALYRLKNQIFSTFPALKQYFRALKNRHFIFKPLEARYREPLSKYSEFYQGLEGKRKDLFEKRVQKFIGMKEFIPRGGLGGVSDDMKALIAGTAIQITFGYPGVYFNHFKKILIYPDDYYSKITRKYHRGEVNLKGAIVLSWKAFLEGYIDKTDGKNLGYHELAHALRLEDGIANDEYGYINEASLDRFNKLARSEMKKIRAGQESFFRKYAAVNYHEFFAVSVETFFESPGALKEYDPELYKALSEVLKQDPFL